jgi:hypothetical protein
MANDKINNKGRASQLHLFEEMGFRRNIVPTDIDVFGSINMFIEYNGRLFIFGEGKYKDAEMPVAQRTALEGLCDAISKVPYHEMWVLLYRHEVHDTNEPVYVKDQYVAEVFSSVNLGWRKVTDIDVIPKFETINGKITMLQAIRQIEDWCENNSKFRI